VEGPTICINGLADRVSEQARAYVDYAKGIGFEWGNPIERDDAITLLRDLVAACDGAFTDDADRNVAADNLEPACLASGLWS